MSLPSITLAEFNRIASGSYNAGQVDFKTNSAGEYTGELVKINNHVIFKSKNNIHLSGERVVAIKEAFLDALQKARVDEKALKEIRAELGMTGVNSTPILTRTRRSWISAIRRYRVTKYAKCSTSTPTRGGASPSARSCLKGRNGADGGRGLCLHAAFGWRARLPDFRTSAMN